MQFLRNTCWAFARHSASCLLITSSHKHPTHYLDVHFGTNHLCQYFVWSLWAGSARRRRARHYRKTLLLFLQLILSSPTHFLHDEWRMTNLSAEIPNMSRTSLRRHKSVEAFQMFQLSFINSFFPHHSLNFCVDHEVWKWRSHDIRARINLQQWQRCNSNDHMQCLTSLPDLLLKMH